VPIHYPEFSIVDDPGFSEHPSPGRVVKTDPRDATAEKGKKIFEDAVGKYIGLTKKTLKEKGL